MEIRKVFVANRGEIAARVFRTCRRLGVGTVAAFAPDDAGAFHTRAADEAVPVPGYLDAESLVQAARDAGADAIHPGYGFLAENGDFAEAAAAADIVFVGPSPAAIRSAGDKLEAKRLALEAGVPVVESGEPEEIGYPLIVKAAAGGGGRGMRVVRSADELEEALEAAAREAEAGFGTAASSASATSSGRGTSRSRCSPTGTGRRSISASASARSSAATRRCSRKAPPLRSTPTLRAAMGEAAVAFARVVGYENAGTAEFMLDGDRFYFLELNARLQVEHPVTELVTGLDLVEQQLRIAAGEPLDVRYAGARGPRSRGAAVRRAPAHVPAPGGSARAPASCRTEIRVDAGVEAGDEVPVAYDPLLAKLIAHGETREDAFDTLSRALRATRVSGATTNLGFLRWLVDHPAVRAGETTTAFLTEHPPLSLPARDTGPWAGYWRLNRDRAQPAPEPGRRRRSRAPPTRRTARTRRAPWSAPMPGVVIRVLAGEGDRVEPRQPLVVLEAMKMETPLVSPYEAVVKRVHVAEGDRVAGGALLVELED